MKNLIKQTMTLVLISTLLSSCSREQKVESAPNNEDKSKAEAQNDKPDKPETLVEEYDETEMDKAIAKSKSLIANFHKAYKAQEADSYSIKAPITDPNGTEHFWLTNVTYKDGVFKGMIGNEPGIVKNVKYGQMWTIKEENISDWMYMKNNRIYGGYTIDPLLKTTPKDQADAIRARLVR